MNAALLQSLKDKLRHRWPGEGVHSRIAGIDALLGPSGLARGAIHEVLSPERRHVPRMFALLLARAALGSGAIVWCCEKDEDTRKHLAYTREGFDCNGTWYPPAAAAMGIPADRLILLKPEDAKQMLWATAECLRCKGVSVTIARLRGKLGSLDARRLQLAAEAGGGIGVLLRSAGSSSAHYAAATRWLVEPAPGEALVQRWKVTLLHGGGKAFTSGGKASTGHGGPTDSPIVLEVHRETHAIQTYSLHPPQELADQPAQAKALRPAASRRIA